MKIIMINMNIFFPDITFDKNLISNEKIGSLDIQTNYKVRKYDTNKLQIS